MNPEIPEPHLDHLYQEVILEHNRNPRNFHKLPNPTHYSHGVNPVCGDDYHLYLNIDAKGLIQDVGFEGSGCAISKASASIMSTVIKGKPTGEVRNLTQDFITLLTQDQFPSAVRENVGRLTMFEGVKEFPIRVKCATLIWHALKDAIPNP
jgi:nitrogen fixation NifU-like protein